VARPAVDVVIPFRGTDQDLSALRGRMAALALGEADTLTIVDNREHPVASSYYARNRGAERGTAEWIVFLDADVTPRPGLLDAYFDPEPAAATGLLAGGIEDGPGESVAERYAAARGSMSQENVARRGDWSFAQTANAAVRRVAFAAACGFEEGVRSGGDADLAFRLRALGWEMEERPGAVVTHHNRTTLRALLRNRARHGSGSAWADRRHPGSFPARRWPGLAWWGARRWAEAARTRDLEAAIDPLAVWAYELGRLVPNRARRQR
jgi:GT2 family glycosyltransferase